MPLLRGAPQGVARGGHRRAFRWLLLHLPRLPPAAASLSALSGPGSALLGPGAAGVAVLPDRCALTMARCLKEAVLGGHAWLLPWWVRVRHRLACFGAAGAFDVGVLGPGSSCSYCGMGVRLQCWRPGAV